MSNIHVITMLKYVSAVHQPHSLCVFHFLVLL
jgi:hypothetical protein